MRGSKPGERRGGRQKGTPNKLTVDVKGAIAKAFDKAGGAEYLQGIAKTNPAVFCTLLAKIVPPPLPEDKEGNQVKAGLIWLSPQEP